MNPTANPLDSMLALSHDLGREERRLAILGEGNTSARIDEATFAVKASGSNLATLSAAGTAACRFDKLVPLLSVTSMSDLDVDNALFAARVKSEMKKPSVEAIFHAYLLTLPGINFVGHTHPVAVNSLLCSKHALTFAQRRLFPDEIVCCGVQSAFVPYTDPGLKLSQAIKSAVEDYIRRLARAPRIILLKNHGLIALGASPEAVLVATLMAEKAAEIYLGACAASGGAEPEFLSAAEIERIAERPDEHYRQRALGLSPTAR